MQNVRREPQPVTTHATASADAVCASQHAPIARHRMARGSKHSQRCTTTSINASAGAAYDLPLLGMRVLEVLGDDGVRVLVEVEHAGRL